MKRAVGSTPRLEALEPRILLSSTPTLAALRAGERLDLSPLSRETVSGRIASGAGNELYRLTAPASGTITLRLARESGRLDPLLEVYSVSGGTVRRVAVNNNASRSTRNSAITRSVRAGEQLFVRALGAGRSAGAYSLTVTPRPIDDVGNTLAAAAAGARQYGDVDRLGKINYAGDVDVLALVATESGVLSLRQDPYSGDDLLGALRVYDSSGALLGADLDGSDPGAALDVAVVAGRTYYVKLSALGGTTGRYRFTTQIDPAEEAPAPLVSPDESYQPGATIATHVISQAGGLLLAVIGTNGADVITLSQTAASITMLTSAGTQNFAGAFTSIVLSGFAGNDTLRLDYSVFASSVIEAGDGNDQIFENSAGAATVYGGAGNDLLVTVGGGADQLYGLDGLDSFWFDASDQVRDACTAETLAKTVHRISAFLQPVAGANVSLQIAGQNIVDPTAGYAYRDYSSRRLFVDGPEYNDIRQGALGDCYFVAALSSLAVTDPEFIRQMITPLGDGTYAVRFFRNGQETYLRVDAQLPGSPSYAALTPDGELWVALAEKAYAQFRYNANSYASIEGGNSDVVFAEVTGASTSRVYAGSYNESSLAQFMQTHLAAGHALGGGSWSDAGNGIVGSHAYTIRSVQASGGSYTVSLYNPWGSSLSISIQDFRESFAVVYVSMA